MAATEANTVINCPFWSALSLECRICKSGLFIPLDNHIEVYCKTTEYPQCLQYALHPQSHLKTDEKNLRIKKNRRRYNRVEACVKVTVVRYLHSGKVGPHHSTWAKTLDISSGGMRLITNRPFPHKSTVELCFDTSFPKHLQACSGQVAWCNKEIDAPGYQAGISFFSKHLIEAMSQYLSIHQHLK